MGAPLHHANASASKYGGVPEDYLEIHELMDSSGMVLADNRHRVLTHTSWFITAILPRIFGNFITNSEGKRVPVKYIGTDHILEDYHMKFVPTAQDFLENMRYQEWMQNGAGEPPPSAKRLLAQEGPRTTRINFD